MKIHSNKQLLNIINNHEVGIKYPKLVSCIAFNILIQKDTAVFDPTYYPHFNWWFQWYKSREGHKYWYEINCSLEVVD